jgi:hypothetical protein
MISGDRFHCLKLLQSAWYQASCETRDAERMNADLTLRRIPVTYYPARYGQTEVISVDMLVVTKEQLFGLAAAK